jgi:hypothetical protein
VARRRVLQTLGAPAPRVDEIRAGATSGLPLGAEVPALLPPPLRLREPCEKAGGASRCPVSRARVGEARITIRPRSTSGGSGRGICAGA